ncbi:MAG: hypothetical protein KGL39_06775 [Patescibacteria group bacterium]|nr:hypothetical protein [Patescibacteria group bacterium]
MQAFCQQLWPQRRWELQRDDIILRQTWLALGDGKRFPAPAEFWAEFEGPLTEVPQEAVLDKQAWWWAIQTFGTYPGACQVVTYHPQRRETVKLPGLVWHKITCNGEDHCRCNLQ